MAQRRIGIFTIASKNYLALARALFRSIEELHPEYARFLCLADRIDGYFDPAAEAFQIVAADQLGIAHFEDMTIRYSILEFNTAIKPFMFQWMLRNTDLDTVIYLDPDIHVYSRMTALEEVLADRASVVLIPHTTRPLEDGAEPDDLSLMRAGVFNLGFAAVNRDEEADRFIAWWSRRVQTRGGSDQRNGEFTDQKWCDLAPCFLDRLTVFKNKAYNVAYWNLSERAVVFGDGRWLVDGSPLVFFHFSGISVTDPEVVSVYQNRFTWSDLPHVRPLFEDYRARLVESGYNEARSWPYAYSATSDGWAIPNIVRKLYREEFPEPVDLRGLRVSSLLQATCGEMSESVRFAGGDRVTKLMFCIFREDEEAQRTAAFDSMAGRDVFVDWFRSRGAEKYGLPISLLRYGGPGGRIGRREGFDVGHQSATLFEALQAVWNDLDRVSRRRHAPIVLALLELVRTRQ